MNATIGLFPAFRDVSPGGVQSSGRIAWEGISRAVRRRGGRAFLFAYGGRSGGSRGANPDCVEATSRWQAVVKALAVRREADLLLVWHTGLLKLSPLLAAGHCRRVLFLHGIEVWRRQGLLSRRLLSRIDLFLANSRHTWRRFIEFNPQCASFPHLVSPLGVEAPAASPREPASPAMALMISRLDRREDYKGHREVLEAWPLVQREIPSARLAVVGDGDLRPDLEKLAASLGLGDSVSFKGWVSEPEKDRLLQECRCFALPSRGEGFGLVYAEAMRLGRPCLVSDCDAGREVVNPPEAGLEADPASPRRLAKALCRLLGDGDEWRTWSRQAEARYRRLYTAESFQQRLAQALGIDQAPSQP